jgi:hypothetical protein
LLMTMRNTFIIMFEVESVDDVIKFNNKKTEIIKRDRAKKVK